MWPLLEISQILLRLVFRCIFDFLSFLHFGNTFSIPTSIHVMTRDSQTAPDAEDSLSDAEVYAALWATTPFPRLPHDAPNEMKKLAIDIDDPKRVYAIHLASRRHHFHILVERCAIIHPTLPLSCLTHCLGIFFKSDTAASLRTVIQRHVSPVANVLRVVLLSEDTMQRVREH